MSRLDMMIYRAWYGPLRRPVRAIARRIAGEARIVLGPLKGRFFRGKELVCRMGIYELHVQYLIRDLLDPGDVLYDIGANNGYLSLLGAQCTGPTGRVFSFEPLPANGDRINALMNENRMTNFELVRMAVSNSAGEMEFFIGGDEDPYTPSLIRDRRSRSIKVMVTTIDEFVAGNPAPDLIKMDIEGAEVMAVKGADRLLASPSAPKLLIEVHSQEIDQEISSILRNHGYTLKTIRAPFDRRPYPNHLLATKTHG